MKRLALSSVKELETTLARFGDDALYRGQVKHYGALNAPAMKTSFSRKGCDPHNMPKWLHYASMAMSALVPTLKQSANLEFTQAILQHYGWRSWFLDASSDPAISSWFASHAYSEKPRIDMLEDCFEDWIWLRRKRATYAPSEGDGHLYVLSKEKLADARLQAVNLSSISLPGYRPRFHAQAAWLIGPLASDLPVSTIDAHITAPASTFRAYAEKNGISEIARVFPNAEEDPVLTTLLALPWERIHLPKQSGEEPKFDPPAYHRALELPEYFDDGYVKIMPPHFAFYDSKSIMDRLTGDHGIHVHRVEDIVMYGEGEITMRFPHVTRMLEEHTHIVFEVDALIRLPESGPADHYSKGISVKRSDDGTISVGDLVVDHPGRQITGVGVNFGWHYIIGGDGIWARVEHADQCRCPNAWRHEQHLSTLSIIDQLLGDQKGQ